MVLKSSSSDHPHASEPIVPVVSRSSRLGGRGDGEAKRKLREQRDREGGRRADERAEEAELADREEDADLRGRRGRGRLRARAAEGDGGGEGEGEGG